jgi:hypothetical protein
LINQSTRCMIKPLMKVIRGKYNMGCYSCELCESSTCTSLIPKDWYINNTTTHWSIFFLLWNWWWIVRIWPIYEKFQSILWLLVLYHLASLWWCISTEIGVLMPMVELDNIMRERDFLCVHTRTRTHIRAFLRVLTHDLWLATRDRDIVRQQTTLCFATSIPFKSETVAY